MFPGSEHAKTRLTEDTVAWLTTVSSGGKPSTAPVWFLLEDDSILLYSRDPSVRVSNVRENDYVTLALNSDPNGYDIVVVNGRASIDMDAPSVPDNDPYLAKYRERLDHHDWSPTWFAEQYPTSIRIAITSVTGR